MLLNNIASLSTANCWLAASMRVVLDFQHASQPKKLVVVEVCEGSLMFVSPILLIFGNFPLYTTFTGMYAHL